MSNITFDLIKHCAHRLGIAVSRYPPPESFLRHLGDYLSHMEINVVLDVGANVGNYARLLREVGYAGKIISFEPVPATYQQLHDAMHNDPFWSGEQFGLSDENREALINTYSNGEFNSLLTLREDGERAYSIDPAQWYPTSFPVTSSTHTVSYVRPSLTVLPYAIANNLPFYLAASFSIGTDPTVVTVAQNTSNFFFTNTNVNLSNQKILLAWESGHIRPFLNALMTSYAGPNAPQLQITVPTAGGWPDADYDTIWTVTLDAQGNLTVDNDLCEGIDSASLPVTAPQF